MQGQGFDLIYSGEGDVKMRVRLRLRLRKS